MASVEELLDEMEDILSEGRSTPFSNKMTVDVEALKTVIEDIRLNVPEEVKQAKILASERREIMNMAGKEADSQIENAKIISKDLLSAAEQRSRDMDQETARRTEELMRIAQQKSQKMLEDARKEADRLISRENIIAEAQTRSDQIKATAEDYINEAKAKAERIVQDADFRADAKMAAAEKWSHDLKVNASKYVDEIVNEADYRIGRSYSEIQKLKEKLDVAARGTKSNDKKAAENKPRNDGMTPKHEQNKARNAKGAYGSRRDRPSVVEDMDDDIQIIRHQSVIDIPLDDDTFPMAFDDPPLHERPNYNIEL